MSDKIAKSKSDKIAAAQKKQDIDELKVKKRMEQVEFDRVAMVEAKAAKLRQDKVDEVKRLARERAKAAKADRTGT